MLEIWLVVAMLGLGVLFLMGHAWLLAAAMFIGATGLAVGSAIQFRRYGMNRVFPFSHHSPGPKQP